MTTEAITTPAIAGRIVSDHRVIETMQRYGGHYANLLALLWLNSDAENKNRIKLAWPEYWSQFSAMAMGGAA